MTVNQDVIASLLKQVGIQGHFKLQPLTGGRNNRVFRMEINEKQFLLKSYFRHESDPRDRLGSEFSFLQFAWHHGIQAVPQPLACDRQNHLGLYEFIPGRTLQQDEITYARIQEAQHLFKQLNQFKHLPEAQSLPEASESCFSLTSHMNLVEKRLKRLATIQADSPLHEQVSQFVQNELILTWKWMRIHLKEQARQLHVDLNQAIPPEDRCLSPSDFGFHNAILTPQNQVRFIDFEYAGWDDPVQMICDFFCQVDVPVPMAYLSEFSQITLESLPNPDFYLKRMSLLLPVHQLKWCCILLNDFLPVDRQRRSFANQGEEEHRKTQLKRAYSQLINIKRRNNGDLH